MIFGIIMISDYRCCCFSYIFSNSSLNACLNFRLNSRYCCISFSFQHLYAFSSSSTNFAIVFSAYSLPVSVSFTCFALPSIFSRKTTFSASSFLSAELTVCFPIPDCFYISLIRDTPSLTYNVYKTRASLSLRPSFTDA